jgi:hypothetical protein
VNAERNHHDRGTPAGRLGLERLYISNSGCISDLRVEDYGTKDVPPLWRDQMKEFLETGKWRYWGKLKGEANEKTPSGSRHFGTALVELDGISKSF